MARNKLNLPKDLTEESAKVIGKVYREIGSITKCKTIEDFGVYRNLLVQVFDKEIKELKKTISNLELMYVKMRDDHGKSRNY